MIAMLRQRIVLLLLVVLACAPVVAQEARDERGWLGVMLGPSAAAGESGEARGAIITAVIVDSPAERADLRESDVVLAIEGSSVGSPQELVERIRGLGPGSWVSLTVDRRGEEHVLRPRLITPPSDPQRLRIRHGWIGIEAIDLPPSLREHFGAPSDAGVMIANVVPGSSAEAAGLRPSPRASCRSRSSAERSTDHGRRRRSGVEQLSSRHRAPARARLAAARSRARAGLPRRRARRARPPLG
jgi:S1-C subfamily serine protease